MTSTFLLLSCLGSVSLQAAAPALLRLKPAGAQRGKPFTLTLVGKNLVEGTKVISTLPAAFTPLSPAVESTRSRPNDELPFLVELQGNTPVGLYPVRVSSPAGLSNVLLFSVGVFPEQTEKESELLVHDPQNDSLETAEIVSVPMTVNGTLQGPDRDFYRFQGKKGERLVLEVEARRQGSALDPVIRLLDSQKREIAVNGDAPGLGQDCRLDAVLPGTGEYFVLVHDARFSAQEQNFYRLKLGQFAFADGFFPLGGRRGDKVVIRWSGGNASGAESTVDLSGLGAEDEVVMVRVPGDPGALPFPFVVGDLSEMIATEEPPAELELPASTVVNGRISKAGEVDRYKLRVSPGEQWLIQLSARDLGTSELYPVLTLYDPKGTRLASAGDDIPNMDVFALVAPGKTSSDPYLNYTVPAGMTELTVAVEDLVQRGGPLLSYRLLAERKAADFRLTIASPFLNIPANGTSVVTVTADRRGYQGEILLSVPEAGEDFIVEGGVIPAEEYNAERRVVSRTGVLTISAKPGVPPRPLSLSVVGRGVLPDGTVIERRASGVGMVTPVLGGTGVPDPTGSDQQKPFVATWLGMALPAVVTKEAAGRLVIDGPRKARLLQGGEHEISWHFESEQTGMQPPRRLTPTSLGAREIRIAQDDPEAKYLRKGQYRVVTTVGTPPGTFNVFLSGDLEVGDDAQKIYSPAVSIEVVEGYKLLVPSEGIQLSQGGTGELVGKVQRDPAFSELVTIKPENFPLGVQCQETEVSGTQETFRISCRAAESVPPGEYRMDLISTSTLGGRDKERVPYRIDPVPARIVVTGQQKAAKLENTGR
ncbi:MAG: hypothetical protein AB1898_00270 [Acidobacteriota bacterium]